MPNEKISVISRLKGDTENDIEDEPSLVELFTGLTPQRVDELPESDFVKILEVGHGLNFNSFMAWLKRTVEAKKMKARAYEIDLPTNESVTAGETYAKTPAGSYQ